MSVMICRFTVGHECSKIAGIGPGLVFARQLAKQDSNAAAGSIDRSIGLVPCAVGGTALSEWMPSQRLYLRMVQRTHAALVAAPEATLAGVLWYAGIFSFYLIFWIL